MNRFLLALVAAGALPFCGAPQPALAQTPAAPALTRVTVAPDGSGDFRTVQAAIDAAPLGKTGRFVIRIQPGTYHEKLLIPAEKGPITLQGSDAATTILTFDDFAGRPDAAGAPLGTSKSYSTNVLSDDFAAENLTFENSHEIGGGVGNQALALSYRADRGVFRHCRFLGRQDTVYADRGRAYFEDCFIAGQVDFIFGSGAAWFERCGIRCVAPGIAITAPSTPETQPFGYVFSNCKITAPEGADWKTHLGRPWRPFGSAIWLHTEMADIIAPEGWNSWNKPDKPDNEKTARFSEWASTGPGASPATRAAWSRPLSDAEAGAITLARVMGDWNPQTVLATLDGTKAAN